MAHRISVLMAIDEQYAAPLLVTVGSLLESLRPGTGLDLFVMGAGLTPQTRTRLEGAWDERVRFRWVQGDDSKLGTFRGYGHTSPPAACFRLMAGSSLPDEVVKVIYLDSDLLIRGDLLELWEQDMRGNIVVAVQDAYLQKLRPYFNSGVMVIDLRAWRAARIEECCLAAASRRRHRTKWLDQDLLNECLAGRWGRLPPVWNKQFALDLFPDWQCSPYEQKEFEAARSHPEIVHFSSITKPWHVFCDHQRQDVLAYRAVLMRVAPKANWEGTPSLARRAAEYFAAPHRRLLDTAAAAVRTRQRKHALRMMLPSMLRVALLHPWTLLTVLLSIARERMAIWWSGPG